MAKTPCIGICSATSLGDLVCRGCKRYGFEVINWNGYDADAKQAVLSRIEKFTVQILSSRFHIFSESALRNGLEQNSIPFDSALSPYCWLHNLLKKRRNQIGDLRYFGVTILPDYTRIAVAALAEQVDDDLQALHAAHLERYGLASDHS
ncbi:MAG: DUF1289 domain-containing protein [Gammaproteobacteria bacterium]|nr:DUF1289 domain-containing protein [Gammaproteobacteria bacterium]HBW83368.1 DUF1289 domain-containing protein [Gammaproteobacteria bacterium]|tara:strand:- start:1195 stop:1641 length:447 start_codon:yes stop_codon:yes gene_type:complete